MSKTYTETIEFKVFYKNVPDQHSILPSHDSILKVKVNAFGFSLLTHNFYEHKLTVDFNKEVQRRDNKYYWDTSKGLSRINSELGSSIKVSNVQPDSMVFPYETMSVKTVPIKFKGKINYSSGYDVIDSLKLQPDSVKVIGPKNVIEQISKINTKTIVFDDINNSIDKEVELDLGDSVSKIKLSTNKTRILGDVEKFTEGTFEVPVGIINLPKNIKINFFPKTVMVSYYVSLENYKTVKLLDFKVVCDYDEVKNLDKSFFTPKLVSIPKAVKSAKLKQHKIEFIIIE